MRRAEVTRAVGLKRLIHPDLFTELRDVVLSIAGNGDRFSGFDLKRIGAF